jgi:hypothetical protein
LLYWLKWLGNCRPVNSSLWKWKYAWLLRPRKFIIIYPSLVFQPSCLVFSHCICISYFQFCAWRLVSKMILWLVLEFCIHTFLSENAKTFLIMYTFLNHSECVHFEGRKRYWIKARLLVLIVASGVMSGFA